MRKTCFRFKNECRKSDRQLNHAADAYLYPNDQHQLDVCYWLYGPQSKIHQGRKDPLHLFRTAQDRCANQMLHCDQSR